MNLEVLTKTALAAVKKFFEPAGKAWVVLPRAGRALAIAIGVYVAIWILSSIPSLVAPLVGITILWAAAYVGLTKRSNTKKNKTDVPLKETTLEENPLT